MTLAQSVAVIMGANIGSTVTAQLLAFNLSAYSLLPNAIGYAMHSSRSHDVVIRVYDAIGNASRRTSTFWALKQLEVSSDSLAQDQAFRLGPPVG